jgi:DNA-binding transcriptional regulator YiaG
MEYSQFTQQLKALGIKKTEFMRYVGMGQSTISTWSNAGKVPYWVKVHLELLLKVKALLPDLSQYGASADSEEVV